MVLLLLLRLLMYPSLSLEMRLRMYAYYPRLLDWGRKKRFDHSVSEAKGSMLLMHSSGVTHLFCLKSRSLFKWDKLCFRKIRVSCSH